MSTNSLSYAERKYRERIEKNLYKLPLKRQRAIKLFLALVDHGREYSPLSPDEKKAAAASKYRWRLKILRGALQAAVDTAAKDRVGLAALKLSIKPGLNRSLVKQLVGKRLAYSMQRVQKRVVSEWRRAIADAAYEDEKCDINISPGDDEVVITLPTYAANILLRRWVYSLQDHVGRYYVKNSKPELYEAALLYALDTMPNRHKPYPFSGPQAPKKVRVPTYKGLTWGELIEESPALERIIYDSP